jgi:tetratricopeptide (TPR) repeat protein
MPEKSLPLQIEALAAMRRVMGERHSMTLAAMTGLGAAYLDARQYDKAEPAYREALALSREVLGEDHRGTLITMVDLGRLLRLTERYAEAEPLLTEGVERFRRVQGLESPRTCVAMSELASVYNATGRFAEADPLTAAALDGGRKAFPAGHAVLTRLLRARADCLDGLSRADEALELRDEAERIAGSPAPAVTSGTAKTGS